MGCLLPLAHLLLLAGQVQLLAALQAQLLPLAAAVVLAVAGLPPPACNTGVTYTPSFTEQHAQRRS